MPDWPVSQPTVGNFGERAQLGARAVGGDDEPRAQRFAAGQLDPRGVAARREADDRAFDRLDAERGGGAVRAPRATSSLNAIWASGSPSRASNFNCSSRTASLTPPS